MTITDRTATQKAFDFAILHLFTSNRLIQKGPSRNNSIIFSSFLQFLSIQQHSKNQCSLPSVTNPAVQRANQKFEVVLELLPLNPAARCPFGKI
jgi:hypothetical protein